MKRLLATASIFALFSSQALAAFGGTVNQGAGAPSTPWSVGGLNQAVSAAPTVANSSHATNVSIGGLMSLGFFRTTSQPSAVLDSISLYFSDAVTTTMTVWVFNANPSASTCTDNSAFVLNSADISKLATAPFTITPAASGGTTSTFGSYTTTFSVKNSASATTLYVCVTVGATFTPAANDMTLVVSGVND